MGRSRSRLRKTLREMKMNELLEKLKVFTIFDALIMFSHYFEFNLFYWSQNWNETCWLIAKVKVKLISWHVNQLNWKWKHIVRKLLVNWKKWNWKQISWKLFWRLKSKSQNRYCETWWSIEKWKLKQISRKLPPIEINVWYEQKRGQVDQVHGQSDSIH